MQTFDYDQVQTKMNQLRVVFDSFNSRLKRMDESYSQDMANTTGALYGGRASAAISKWYSFTTSFVLFEREFKELYDSVQQVARNLRLLEEEAVTMANTGTGYTSPSSSTTSTTSTTPTTPTTTSVTPPSQATVPKTTGNTKAPVPTSGAATVRVPGTTSNVRAPGGMTTVSYYR